MIQLPDYCEWCGAFLEGGATIHKDDCFIKKLIEEAFPAISAPTEETKQMLEEE